MPGGRPVEVGNRDLIGSRLEKLYRQERRRTAALKLLGYLSVLVASFLVTLLVLQHSEQTNNLKRAAVREAYKEVEFAQTKAVPTVSGFRVYSPSTGTNAIQLPDRAFDGSQSPDSFWEANPFPIDLIVILIQPRVLSTYTISAGELTNRMPRSWVLEGFSEDRTLITLDRQEGVESWRPDETRSFRIEAAAPVNALRFQFRAGFENAMRS